VEAATAPSRWDVSSNFADSAADTRQKNRKTEKQQLKWKIYDE
jgi:hypothetical protein